MATEALQGQLKYEVNAKEELSGNLALQEEAVAVARKAIKRVKDEHNRFEKRAKAAEKKVEDMRRTLKSLRKTIATLKVDVRTATKVHSPAPSVLCLLFFKFTFGFLG